jgi:mannose-6-phosphate isomerase-like protein (cupin superfamily)
MKRREMLLAGTAAALALNQKSTDAEAQSGPAPVHPLFGRNDPSKYMHPTFGHGGAGMVSYMELTPRDRFKSQFLFLHRGVLEPKSGLGEHVHRKMEEMYFVLDNTACEFTVCGRTALLPGQSHAVCPMGSSHGIYNPTDHPVEFMNLGVSFENRQYDNVDFAKENDLAQRTLDSPPPFLWNHFDKNACREVPAYYNGKGVMRVRQLWLTEHFRTNWGFVNHYCIPAGNSVGYHRHEIMEEVYYIHSGAGKLTIDNTTIPVKAGDAVSCPLGSSHGFFNNSGQDTEILSIAVPMEKGKYDGITLNDDLTKR